MQISGPKFPYFAVCSMPCTSCMSTTIDQKPSEQPATNFPFYLQQDVLRAVCLQGL